MSDCSASIDGWCETHSTSEGAAWCVDALRDAMRRSRFHERENHHRAVTAEAAIARVQVLADRWANEAEERGLDDSILTDGVAAMLHAALHPEELA